MSDCERIALLLPEHLAGELDQVRAASVRAHLVACAACRAEEADLREVLAALDADVAPEGLGGVADPGERYWAAFAGRVRTARAARSLAGRQPMRLLPRLVLALSTAAVLALALWLPRPDGGGVADDDLLAALALSPAADALVELDREALDDLHERLAAAPKAPARPAKPAATPTPRASPAPTAVPAPTSSRPAARGEDDSPAITHPLDALDELSPEELDELLERLDAIET